MIWLSAGCVALACALSLPAAPPHGRARSRARPSPRPVAMVGAGLAAWLFVGGPAGPVAGVAGAVAAGWVLARVEPPGSRRRRAEVEQSLPHLIELFATTLRAGAEPMVGLAAVCAALPGPAADRLALVIEHARWGASVADAWGVVADDEALAPLARALMRSHASGSSVVDVVERLADGLEQGSLARAEDAARRVGVAAAVPLGVCLLPAFLLLGVVPTVASLFGSVAP